MAEESFLDLFDVLYLLSELEKRKAEIKRIPSTISPWRQRVYRIYQHKFYDCGIYLLSIFSLLLLFWREYMEVYGDNGDFSSLRIWIIICLSINFIFFVDLIFRFIYQGFRLPFRSFYALLEMLFPVLIIGGVIKYFILGKTDLLVTN